MKFRDSKNKQNHYFHKRNRATPPLPASHSSHTQVEPDSSLRLGRTSKDQSCRSPCLQPNLSGMAIHFLISRCSGHLWRVDWGEGSRSAKQCIRPVSHLRKGPPAFPILCRLIKLQGHQGGFPDGDGLEPGSTDNALLTATETNNNSTRE